MAERSIVEILMRAKGGRAVASETGTATRGVDKLGRASSSATKHLTALGSAATVAGAALGYGLYRGARKSLEAFAESEKVGAQTVARLKATGMAAGVTKKQIESYAASLSQLSAVDDEEIQSAENMILTFRGIRSKAFKPTLDAALDLSAGFTAMGKTMSVQDAALLLGKALNDPAKGMSRLTRQGITLNDGLQEQIKTLSESGQKWKAQQLILKEVEREFGGSAKAAGKTTAGAMDRLSVSVENAEEAIGMGLAPAVSYAANGLNDFVNGAIPDLTRLSKGLDATFGRKDLDMAGKLAVASRQVRKSGKPYAEQLVQGLKDAHLDQKLEDAVVWAAPKIADGFATAAPRAAKTFVEAFLHSGPWGMLATALYGGVKVRKLLGTGSKGGIGGLLTSARGTTPANPLFVVDVSGGGVPGSKPATTLGKLKSLGKTIGGTAATRSAAAALGTDALAALPLAAVFWGANQSVGLHNNNATRGMAAARNRARAGGSFIPGSMPGQPPASTKTSFHIPGVSRAFELDPRLAGYPDSHRTPTVSRAPLHVTATFPVQLVLTDRGKPLANGLARFSADTLDRNHR